MSFIFSAQGSVSPLRRLKGSLQARLKGYLLASLLLIASILLFLWKPFQEAPLQSQYHSGRDAYTLVPGQLPERPHQPVTETAVDPVSTPQAAAIEAQLSEVKRLTASPDVTQQRIDRLNQLIVKLNAVHGLDQPEPSERSENHAEYAQQTLPLYTQLATQQARTERLDKRLVHP